MTTEMGASPERQRPRDPLLSRRQAFERSCVGKDTGLSGRENTDWAGCLCSFGDACSHSDQIIPESRRQTELGVCSTAASIATVLERERQILFKRDYLD
jgi:hypothetical protein